MQVLVFSDSHGILKNLKTVILEHPKIEYVIHLGDYGTDIDEILSDIPNYLYEAVHGNCDKKKKHPSEKVIQLAGQKLLLTHGHEYGVKYSLTSLINKGIKEKVDAILFGHTHEPIVEMVDGLLIINPGSISKPLGAFNATYSILEIDRAGIQANIYRV